MEKENDIDTVVIEWKDAQRKIFWVNIILLIFPLVIIVCHLILALLNIYQIILYVAYTTLGISAGILFGFLFKDIHFGFLSKDIRSFEPRDKYKKIGTMKRSLKVCSDVKKSGAFVIACIILIIAIIFVPYYTVGSIGLDVYSRILFICSVIVGYALYNLQKLLFFNNNSFINNSK